MVDNAKITIVVPIYNVEKYLDRCIESLVHQSYKNIEIILVDDGSPDRCPSMCDEWAKKDIRIKVIHKKNQGLGMARNTGIENATGDYICFVDSDDYISPVTIEKSYEKIMDSRADIVYYGFSDVGSDGKIVKEYKPEPLRKIYEGEKVQTEFLPELISPAGTNLMMSVCMALFSMDVIRKTKWRLVSEREVISEDLYSLLVLFKDIQKVAIISEAYYFYCRNEESLTHTYRADRYEKIKDFHKKSIKKCEENNYNMKVKESLASTYLSYTIGALKMIMQSDIKIKLKWDEVKAIVEDDYLESVLLTINKEKENQMRKLLIKVMQKKSNLITYFIIWARCRKK